MEALLSIPFISEFVVVAETFRPVGLQSSAADLPLEYAGVPITSDRRELNNMPRPLFPRDWNRSFGCVHRAEEVGFNLRPEGFDGIPAERCER